MILSEENRIKTKIIRAIMEDPEIVLLLKEKYVDEEIWKFCIERSPSLFKKMKHPSEEICMFACATDGSNLKYIKNKFKYIKITREMCVNAVTSNPKSILLVPDNLLDDRLKELAFNKDPSLMLEFPDVREDYLVRLLIEKPNVIKQYKAIDEDILCKVIKESPGICPYLQSFTPKMIRTLAQYHPSYFNLYKNNIDNMLYKGVE